MHRHLTLLVVVFATVSSLTLAPGAARAQDGRVVLVVHGGAGTITPDRLTPEREAAYRGKLEEALKAGRAVLAAGGSSLDAVVEAIQILEASPLFNAGVGAVLTNEGTAELDASLMEGRTRRAGAVAGVQHVASPIALARLVMEASPHVMMVGAGAEAFARDQGVEMIENERLRTEPRRRQLRQMQGRGETGAAAPPTGHAAADALGHEYGTVGAVALDADGTLAAGTSTGGMANKRWGRVGDSPIIGAGTYADDATCGVSATGHGEYFIRGVLAHEVAALMRHAGLRVSEAASAVVHGTLSDMGGTGGVIALDRHGNVAMPFNTPGMYRGYIDEDGNVTVQIFRE